MTDQFPVEWLDPSDAEITWEWDDMHMPGALSALAGDYTGVIAGGMAYGHQRMGTPVEMRIRIWNGYAYYGLTTDVPEAEQEAMWERRTLAARAAIKDAHAYWHERAIPEVRAAYAWVAARPVDLAIIDGIESVAGGEGPWIRGLRTVKPGLVSSRNEPGFDRRRGRRRHGLRPPRPAGHRTVPDMR